MKQLLKYAYWAAKGQLAHRVRQQRAISRIRQSNLFDEDYYALWNPEVAIRDMDPVTHYVYHGASEGRDPHPLFSSHFYASENSDCLQAQANPFDHFLSSGCDDGRSPHPLIDVSLFNSEVIEGGATKSPGDLFSALLEDESVLAAAEMERHYRYGGFEHLDNFVRVAVDSCVLIGGEKAFVTGWVLDPDEVVCTLRLSQGAAISDPILNSASRYDRSDVLSAFSAEYPKRMIREVGFSSLFNFKRVVDQVGRYELRLVGQTTNGQTFMMAIPDIVDGRSATGVVSRLFAEFSVDHPDALKRLDSVGRAVQSCISLREPGRGGSLESADFNAYGSAVENPEVSVVVKLDDGLDAMEYQLSQFASDPDFQNSELVYILDQPEHQELARRRCEDLYGIFQIPFRIHMANMRESFATATNRVVEWTRGHHVLLLGPHVVPRKSRWLSKLREFSISFPDSGPVAPLLVLEDGSIQSCGLAFESSQAMPRLWLKSWPLQGLPIGLANLRNDPRVVAGVSASCMMISRELYLDLGGLDEDYMLPELVDADFCMRARSAGYLSYVVPSVELYCLDAGTVGWRPGSDDPVSLFDCWQWSTRWADSIREVISKSTVSPQP